MRSSNSKIALSVSLAGCLLAILASTGAIAGAPRHVEAAIMPTQLLPHPNDDAGVFGWTVEVARKRREGLLNQLEFYRQGLGSVARRVSDDIIEGEFTETKHEAPAITGPDQEDEE